jgi:hypothetical protein
LKSIAAFTKEMAERSWVERIRKKQSDADDIKKWEKELTRAFELFTVCIVSKSVQNLPDENIRPPLCYTSTLAKRLPRLDKKLIERMVSVHGQRDCDRDA